MEFHDVRTEASKSCSRIDEIKSRLPHGLSNARKIMDKISAGDARGICG